MTHALPSRVCRSNLFDEFTALALAVADLEDAPKASSRAPLGRAFQFLWQKIRGTRGERCIIVVFPRRLVACDATLNLERDDHRRARAARRPDTWVLTCARGEVLACHPTVNHALCGGGSTRFSLSARTIAQHGDFGVLCATAQDLWSAVEEGEAPVDVD